MRKTLILHTTIIGWSLILVYMVPHAYQEWSLSAKPRVNPEFCKVSHKNERRENRREEKRKEIQNKNRIKY